MSFTLVKHTADVKIKVRGENLEEIIVDAVRGMNEILEPEFLAHTVNVNAKREEIEVDSVDGSALVVDVMSEVLALSQINKMAYDVEAMEVIAKKKAKLKLRGEPIEKFGDDIKAVTYHGAELKEVDGGLEITILFDI